MFKKNLSILIVILVLSLVVFNHNVSAKNDVFSKNDLQLIENLFDEAKETNIQDKFVDEIKNVDGSIFATTITETEREIKKDEENGIVYITLKTTQEIKYADGTVETKKSIDDISYSKEGEFYINGEKLSMETLKQEYQPTTEVGPTALVSSGGKSWLTYYEIHDNPTEYYYKAFKAPKNNFLDSPTPDPMRQITTYTKNSNFENLARHVAAQRDTIVAATLTMSAALGGIAISWFTVVSFLIAAGPIGVAAVQLHSASSTAKGYMLEAYNAIVE